MPGQKPGPSTNAPGGEVGHTKSGPENEKSKMCGQRYTLAPSSEPLHLTLSPQEVTAQWPMGPGSWAAKDLSFTLSCLPASPSRKAKGENWESGGSWPLPWSAPTVSTSALGNNPERVRTARSNWDMMIFPVSLCCRLLGGTLGPAASAGSLELSRVIYKCHWKSLGRWVQPVRLALPGAGCGRCAEARLRRACERQPGAVCLDFSMQGYVWSYITQEGQRDARRWEFTINHRGLSTPIRRPQKSHLLLVRGG